MTTVNNILCLSAEFSLRRASYGGVMIKNLNY